VKEILWPLLQYQVKMKNNKRGISGFIWIMIILVVVFIGIVAYLKISGGGSVPLPPALPA